jgi:hypothetical protein
LPVHPSAAVPPVAAHEAPAETLQLRVTDVPVVTEEALAERLRPMGAIPVSAMVEGAPSETTVRVPVGLPAAIGLNVTETVQRLPAVNVGPQLLLCAKSPVTDAFPSVRGEVSELVSVTD